MSVSETTPTATVPVAPLTDDPDDRLFHLLRTSAGAPVAAAADRVLVDRYAWIVERCARQYLGRGEQLDELRQAGYVGLMKAIRGFDPAKENEFQAYAWPTVRGEIRKHFRDHRRWVQIPRKYQDLKRRIKTATDELTQREGRSPRVEDLAAVLGRPAEEIREALDTQDNFAPFSLDMPLDSADSAAESWGALFGEDDHQLDLWLEFESLRPLLAQMTPRDRRIVLLRYYGNCTQQEIAEATGLSQMQVSRILKRVLNSLRAALSTG